MKKIPLLIATTNKHKAKEMLSFLGDLPFKFLTLNDLKNVPKAPAEAGKTLEENAILKARYYGEKTGLICLANDTGLFINALKGWPGVISARVGTSGKDRRDRVLAKMKNTKNRQAEFRAVLAIYDPNAESLHTMGGSTKGKITKVPGFDNGFDYDMIFSVSEKNKIYSEMTVTEKNAVSHRGKALIKIKYLLQNIYCAKHIVVPVAIIIKNGKILVTKRNDPHRPEYHERWEFPGGSMEMGETIEENLIREASEEAGYIIEPLEQLKQIYIKEQRYPTWSYQVYLIPYICSISGGTARYNDAEVLDARFIEPEEMGEMKFVDKNEAMFKKFLPELKQLIKKYHL